MELKMLDKDRIRNNVRTNSSLSDVHKKELLQLIDSLDEELQGTDVGNAEQKNSISRINKVMPEVAGEGERIGEIREAVEVFEATHPRITMLIDRICRMLSDSGI